MFTPAEVLRSALDAIADTTGMEIRADRITGSLEVAEGTTLWSVLPHAVEASGLLIRHGSLPDHEGNVAPAARLLDAMERVATTAPLIVCLSRVEGEVAFDEVFVALERHGRQVRVQPTDGSPQRWVNLTALGDRIEQHEKVGVVNWLVVENPAPLQALGRTRHETSSIKRLWPWLRLDRSDLATVLVYASAVGVLGLTTPLAVQWVVSTVAFGTLLQPLVVLTALLTGALALAGGLRALEAWVVEVIQRRIFARVVAELSTKLVRGVPEELETLRRNDMVNRYFEIFSLQKTMSTLLIGGLEVVLTAIVGMIILGFYHPLLLALDAFLVVSLGAVALLPASQGIKTAVKESKQKYVMATWLDELARAGAAWRLGQGPELARARTHALSTDYMRARSAHWRVSFTQLAGVLAIQAAVNAAVLGLGGWLVIERRLTLGQLVAAELVVAVIVASLAKVGKYIEAVYDLIASLEKLGAITDVKLESAEGDRVAMTRGVRIEFEKVCVALDGRDLITDASFVIDRGDRVGLRGAAGSGKSLLGEVILGIRHPKRGSILVAGYSRKDVSMRLLRQHFSLISSTSTVATSVLDNVRWGNPKVDRTLARESLLSVGLDELADNLDRELADDLSPSERFRLSVARALATRPLLVIVDHGVDNLDGASRARILDVLCAQPWTMVMMSEHPDVLGRLSGVLTLSDGVVRRSDQAQMEEG